MLLGSNRKYARLRRESIALYHAGDTPAPTEESNQSYEDILKRRSSDPPSLRSRRLSLRSQPEVPQTPRIRINVSGTIFETFPSTLARFPDSLLGNPEEREKFWDRQRQEYVLDRHIPSFEAVFQFYQTGVLQRPFSVPLYTFMEEVEYYGFSKGVIDEYKKKEGFIIDKKPEIPKNDIKRAIWLSLMYPKSSPFARLYASLSICVIILSVASFCAETMPEFSHVHCLNSSRLDAQGELQWYEVPNLSNVFFLIESGCVCWFTLELLLHFICCPDKCSFLCDKLNIIDVITVIPYAVIISVILITQSCYIAKRSASILIFRVLRVFRIFKLTKHFRGLQIIVFCLRNSIRELRLFIFLIAVGCLVLAVAVYVAEVDHPDTMIQSIPEGIWWAIATMTTVGYGDVYPVGIYGKLVGVICFVTGCVVVALPTPPIVNNFNHYYRIETGRNCDQQDAE